MSKNEDIRRHTAKELEAMIERGEDLTDWAAVDAKTDEDIARDTASDPAWDGIPEDWYKNAVPGIAFGKKLLSVRIDEDVLAWFRAQGPGYQTRMNSVLRAYMQAHLKAAAE